MKDCSGVIAILIFYLPRSSNPVVAYFSTSSRLRITLPGATAKLEDDSLLANLLTVFNRLTATGTQQSVRMSATLLVADGGLNLPSALFISSFTRSRVAGKTELSVRGNNRGVKQCNHNFLPSGSVPRRSKTAA